MKILVVFTGGTIGSSITDGVADTDLAASDSLLALYGDRAEIEFTAVSPFNILSENSNTEVLSKLCSFMLSLNYESYDGVIVTHGSDTLAYTSALLGLVLSWVKIPVTVTAADCVLSMPESNGKNNFMACVDFIRGFVLGDHQNSGVFTMWKNRDEDTAVYISTRLNEADGYLDRFSSFGGVAFGYMIDGKFFKTDSRINPDHTVGSDTLLFLRGKTIQLDDGVVFINSYPGLDYGSISLKGKRAILIKAYHSATLCVDGENTSFVTLYEKCLSKKVPIFIFSVKKTEYLYKSSSKILDKNIKSLYNIGVCSAYAKVLLAFSVDSQRREKILGTNLFYESLPEID